MIDIGKYTSRYDSCELTLCLLKDKQNEKYYNFFSLVELIPIGQFPSEWIRKNKKSEYINIDEKYDFIIDKVKLDTKTALEYYSTESIHFIPNNQQYDRIYDFGKYTEPDCGNQGILVHYDCQNSNCVLDAFIPKYRVDTKVFYKICLDSEFRKLLTDDKFTACFTLMSSCLKISFFDKQEYWGAFLLCMPDYLLQSIEIKLGKSRNSLLVNLFPRKNKIIENITLLLSDEQKNGTGFFFSEPLKSNYNIIQLPQEPDTLHMWLYHTDADGNLELLEESRRRFIKKVVLDMNIKESDIKYHIGDKTVEAAGNTHLPYEFGEEDTESQKLISENEESRYLQRLYNNKIFMYFDGTEEKEKIAKQTVKDLLQAVKKTCVVCDPYFSVEDFENYILPLTARNCLIQIITTENKLAKSRKGGVIDKSSGQELEKILGQLESVSLNRSQIECYVLNNTPDDKTPLHDRFFIVDDNAYLMGSSLNHFGEKATTLYKTPSAKILQRESDIMMKKNSLLLSAWLAK